MRALRRHHRERIKRKRLRQFHIMFEDRIANLYSKEIIKMLNTAVPCSCWMCGNPRKYWKEKSRQEIQFERLEKLESLI